MPKVVIERVNEALEARRRTLQARAKYIAGDHWQDGAQWIGPRPKVGEGASPAEVQKSVEVMDEIRRAFITRNLVREAAARHRGGVVGREVQWKITVRRALADGESPTRTETARIDEVTAALIAWLDASKARNALREAVFDLMWAGTDAQPASSMIRLYVPQDAVQDGVVPTRGTLDEALAAIAINHPKPMQSGMLKDGNGRDLCAFYKYADDDDRDVLELALLERDVDEALLRMLTEEGREPPGFTQGGNAAVVVVIDQRGVRSARYELGGRLPMFELSRETLITNAALDLQNAVNLSFTMGNRNVVQGGFLERIITNAQMPGMWVDADGNEVSASTPGARFTASPVKVGAGTLNYLMGVPIRDDRGEVTGYTQPAVTYRDPVSMQTFRDALDMAREGFYEEVQQAHQLIAGDATPSGRSREQAAEDFAVSLQATSEPVERCMRWQLEALLAWASVFQGRPGAYAELRVSVTPRVSAAQPTTQDKQDAISLKDARIISDETAMTMAGIEDPEAERAQKEKELQEDTQRPDAPPPGQDPNAEDEGE